MKLLHLFFWFVLYSFLGWVWETVLCSIAKKRPVKRGFLDGPVCPIYGMGAVLLLVCLGRFRIEGHWLMDYAALFILGSLLCCTVEYLTGWAMETLFHAKWWDYSKRRFNLHGRVCLIGAVVFGAFSVALLRFVQTLIQQWTLAIPPVLIGWICAFTLVVLLIDTVLTVFHITAFNRRLHEIRRTITQSMTQPKRRHRADIPSDAFEDS